MKRKILLLVLISLSMSASAQLTPDITSLGSSRGCTGSSITINGTGLSNATFVSIGGTPVSSIISNTDAEIIAIIGDGTTGNVSVTTGNGTAKSASIFVVNPLLQPSLTSSVTGILCKGNPVTLHSSGAAGNGIQFSGSGQYISIGKPLTANSSFTKEAWIKTSSNGPEGIIASNSSSLLIVGSKLVARNGNGSPVSDITAFPMDSWTHVAVTYDSATTTLTLYKNGDPVGSDNATPGSPEDSIYIGQYGSAGKFFTGAMDEVRIWNVAKNHLQILSSMNSSVPGNSPGLVAYYKMDEGADTIVYDATGNGLNGTIINHSAWLAPSDAPINYKDYSWSPGNEITSSVTATPQASTTYTLSTSDVNDCFSIDTISVTVDICSGINEINEDSDLEIYPNPAFDILNVQLQKEGKNISLAIYDIMGRNVSEPILNQSGSETQINISDLPSGIYLLRVKSDSGVNTFRFVKSQFSE